jgi:hypothetical protein
MNNSTEGASIFYPFTMIESSVMSIDPIFHLCRRNALPRSASCVSAIV